jgi:hypothetical protein
VDECVEQNHGVDANDMVAEIGTQRTEDGVERENTLGEHDRNDVEHADGAVREHDVRVTSTVVRDDALSIARTWSKCEHNEEHLDAKTCLVEHRTVARYHRVLFKTTYAQTDSLA